MFLSGLNDRPLDFNNRSTKNSPDNKDEGVKSPKSYRRNSRDRKETEKSRNNDDSDCSNLSNPQDVLPIQTVPGNNALWGGVMGTLNYPMMNMLMDPNGLISMGNYGMVPPLISPPESNIPPGGGEPPGIVMNTVKEIIHCNSCTLFPPNPNAPPPTTRERPPGCRTVFVGGLPENITEEIITEVFDRCGEITTLRLSKKNFCHIRFMYESCVDAAIFLSGYRIRIGSNSETANTGRLHVDYAQARDDQYEWECKQRQIQREQRHRERMEEERLRPPSPPPVVHYTDHEAATVAEKIKQDETFTKAMQIVVTWLERGDCNKRNSNNFYSMIQSTNSHVRRLLNEKTQYEDELKKAKEIMKGRMQGILLQFSQIERLFTAACHKKVWDHFTKAQRKNIETWKKQSMEIKNVQLLEELRKDEKSDDEMDVSDEDEPSRKRHRYDDALKDENDRLKCQIEAFKNEIEIIKSESKKELEEKEKQLKVLQQTLNQRETKDNDVVIDLDSNSTETTGDVDVRLISIISNFLNVHPFGANLDYIWSYVSKFDGNFRPSDVELLMSKFPSVFRHEFKGIGANIERRWFYNGFST